MAGAQYLLKEKCVCQSKDEFKHCGAIPGLHKYPTDLRKHLCLAELHELDLKSFEC